jgi:predicted TIM-barrel fold metal-dependent hydrolase
MPVIDVQVHAYERNHPERPWAGHLHGPQSANGEEMVAAMDAVGVDAAIIVSTFNLYRYDPSYALEVYRKYPERFRVVKPIDVTDPAIDDVVADWAKIKGAVGVRIMLRDELLSDPADPRLNRAFAAAGKHGLPVNFLCWGRLDDGTELVKRNPDTVVVIDHLVCFSRTNRRRWRSRGPTCRSCWRWLRIPIRGSRSAVHARCRAGHILTTTSGILCSGSSTPSVSTAACGGRTGRAPAAC